MGILSAAGLNRSLSLSKKCITCKAWLEGNWKIYNKLQTRLYKQRGGKELEEKPIYFRIEWIGAAESCLNLYSLIRDSARNQPLWEMACDYLMRVYAPILPTEKKKRNQWMKQFLRLLLDVQQEALAEHRKMVPLAEIELPNEEMRQLYYKMLRGTNPYDLSKPIGYPPLKEVIAFRKGSKKPVPFRYAHPILLEEALGKNIAAAIVEREKELVFDKEKKKEIMRNTPLKKSELQAIINEHQATAKEKNVALLNHSNFSSNRPPIFWLDPETRIAMRYFPCDQKKTQKNPNKSR
ncbi:MAG: hypothetical protein AAF443_00575 [Chlamydiota bacterium]